MEKKPGGNSKRAVLIYDAQCPVCSATIQWIRENQRKDAFEFIPCKSEEKMKRYPGIGEAVCMEAMQLVLPDGRVLAGENALPEVLKRLKRWSPLSGIFRLPGSEILSRSFYRWFADRRYHIAELLFPETGDNERKRRRRKKGPRT